MIFEFYAEIDLLGVLSACPGGDCSAEHSSDTAQCHPLKVSIFRTKSNILNEGHLLLYQNIIKHTGCDNYL